MYEEFFGFSRRPFSLTPDPAFLYWTDQHRTAFDLVRMSLLRRAPIAMITGEVGAGKTTLLQALLHEISQEFEVGLLSNVVGDSGDLLRWILTAFGHESEPSSRAEALREVEVLLSLKWQEGRRSVLIIDEAQNVSDHGIETLRLLTNMDTGKCAPLSLVMAGQPELRDRISGPAFSAFRQRLGASFHLGPMTFEETADYIRNRIEIAGGAPGVIENGAIEAVYRRAKGVPRLTNLLCDLCFVAAFGEDRNRIDAGFAESALAESLALGGLGGLPAETDAAEPGSKVVMRQAAAFGPPRAVRDSPSRVAEMPRPTAGTRASTGVRCPTEARSLRLVTPEEPGTAGAPPLRLTTPVQAKPSTAASDMDETAPVAEPRLPTAARTGRSGQAVRRIMGSVAGLAVAASIAVAALILPATGTDGGQAPMAGASTIMPATATREVRPVRPARKAVVQSEVAGPPGVIEARLAAPDPQGAQRLFERAVEEADRSPAAAAVDYSRAAARGHGRAAYYLAQMYESGDGVPFAPDTAWNWYAAAAAEVPRAEERLAEIAVFAGTDNPFAAPVFSAAEGSVIELVWQGRGSFMVELAREPDAAEDALVHTTALTVARLEVPEGIGWWRVRAVGSEPSEWTRLGTPAAY